MKICPVCHTDKLTTIDEQTFFCQHCQTTRRDNNKLDLEEIQTILAVLIAMQGKLHESLKPKISRAISKLSDMMLEELGTRFANKKE